MSSFVASLGIMACLWCSAADANRDVDELDFKACVSSRVITPPFPLWMIGYATRNKPAETKEHDLFVKALALEDRTGQKIVLVTTDLLGLPRHLSQSIAEEIRQKTGLSRERLLLTSSHTHCGPVIDGLLEDMLDLSAAEVRKRNAYTVFLKTRIVETIAAALHDLKPARLWVGKGMARFAVNRRKATSQGIINAANPEGPVDHDVPVLEVETPDRKLVALVFGYACHNTTLQYYQWCGDYAGFAQNILEERHPGALAMFWTGCGGDANPLPRGTVVLCQKYGRELAQAVDGVLATDRAAVRGLFHATYKTVSLPLDHLPTREQLRADMLARTPALRNRAGRLLKKIATQMPLEDHYPEYPIQVWKLGSEVLWIALGGEVVVDYSLKLKKEFRRYPRVWVTGYANDVMAYIPSRRVLREGGYEGETSMMFYGLPGRWSPAVEDIILGKVDEMVKDSEGRQGKQ